MDQDGAIRWVGPVTITLGLIPTLLAILSVHLPMEQAATLLPVTFAMTLQEEIVKIR